MVRITGATERQLNLFRISLTLFEQQLTNERFFMTRQILLILTFTFIHTSATHAQRTPPTATAASDHTQMQADHKAWTEEHIK